MLCAFKIRRLRRNDKSKKEKSKKREVTIDERLLERRFAESEIIVEVEKAGGVADEADFIIIYYLSSDLTHLCMWRPGQAKDEG